MLANRREDLRWRRERQREQQVWAREDAARSFEHRRDAYVASFAEYHRVVDMWSGRSFGGASPRDIIMPLYEKLRDVQLFGTAAAFRFADKACRELTKSTYGKMGLSVDVLDDFQAQVRRDLLVPDDTDGGGVS